MSLPRLGIELGPRLIKIIWLSKLGRQKAIEAVHLPVVREKGELYFSPERSLKRLKTVPDRFSFRKKWEAALAVDPRSFILWERQTGKPLTPIIDWRDQRSRPGYRRLVQHQQFIFERTGITIQPGLPLVNLYHFLKQPQIGRKAAQGNLCYGNFGTWLLWNLTDGKLFWTDQTTACRTALYNPDKAAWDQDILQRFALPENILPEVGKQLPQPVKAEKLWKHGTIVSFTAREEAFTLGCQPSPRDRVMVRLGTDGLISGRCSPDFTAAGYNQIRSESTLTRRPRVEGFLPAVGSTVNWLIRVFGMNRQSFNQWVSPPWPEEPPLWTPAFYGGGVAFPDSAPAILSNFTEISSSREFCQGLIISLLFQVKQALSEIAGPASNLKLIFAGDLAKMSYLPELARAILPFPLVVNSSPMVTARGSLIFSDNFSRFLIGNPWDNLHLRVSESPEIPLVKGWQQCWEQQLQLLQV